MRRSWTRPIVTTFLFAAGIVLSVRTLSVGPPDSRRFHYRLRPETSYATNMKTSLKMLVETEGMAAADAAAMVLAGRDIQQDMQAALRLDVGTGYPDGTLPIEGKFEDMRVRVTLGDQVVDASDFKDRLPQLGLLKGRFTPEGRAVDLEVQGADPSIPGDVAQRMLEVLPDFPDRDMKVGDTFETPMRFDLSSLPGGSSDIHATCTYTLRSLGERVAIFDVGCSMAMDTSSAPEGVSMSFKGGTLGSAAFDIAEGIFTSMHQELAIEMAAEMNAPAGAAEGKTEAPSADAKAVAEPQRIKIRAQAKGPLDFTMARVGK